MGMEMSRKEGLLTFSTCKGGIKPEFIEQYKMIAAIKEEKIYKRLLDSKLLIVRHDEHKMLKFPYKHIILLLFFIASLTKFLP